MNSQDKRNLTIQRKKTVNEIVNKFFANSIKNGVSCHKKTTWKINTFICEFWPDCYAFGMFDAAFKMKIVFNPMNSQIDHVSILDITQPQIFLDIPLDIPIKL